MWVRRVSEVSQHVHVDRPAHGVSLDKVKILTVENRKFERGVKEAIYIMVAKPSLNKDGGCYLLPAVWINLLRARVHKQPSPGPSTTIDVKVPHLVPTMSSWSQLDLRKPQRWLKDLSSKPNIILCYLVINDIHTFLRHLGIIHIVQSFLLYPSCYYKCIS